MQNAYKKHVYLIWSLTNRKSNPELSEWMKNMNFGDEYSHLQAYYSSKLLKMVSELNKKSIVWEGNILIKS